MNQSNEQAAANSAAEPTFRIERVFVKDVSFEAPKSPALLLEQWEPTVDVELDVAFEQLPNDGVDATLFLNVTIKKDDQAVIMVAIKQSGIFTISGFDAAQHHAVRAIECPKALYPYAQQLCAQLVQQGGYPPLYLAPVSFEAMYHQHQAQKAQQAEPVSEAEAA